MTHFHDKVIYQAYPKSFNDTEGNGLGDLKGITEKLPYIKELGADMVWLNPVYKSPQNDNGYDIADYKALNPDYGDWDDLENLIQTAKDLGLELMFDMVLNHVSTEHEWFQKALAGDPKYMDYFYLRPLQEDGSLPTNWESKFGGKAWSQFGDTDLYYLHLYDVTQADLNWHNPEVREDLFDVVNFWIEKGIKGFRFDVLNVIGKSEEMEDAEDGVGKSHYTDTPIVHEFIHELNKNSFGNYSDIITVGEMSSTTIDNSVRYSNPDTEELSMVFSFHHLKVDYKDGEKWSLMDFDFLELKKILSDWQVGMAEGGGWNAVFWNNHDQPRANSRFADPVNYPFESATMLGQTIHLMRGTPYIYQGEEIGMTNPGFETIDEYRDIETLNAYKEMKESGMDESEIMEIIQVKSRDNARVPMQWDDSLNAGFTTGTPWIQNAPNYREINAASTGVSADIFKYYQELIRLRKEYKIIQEGSFEPIQLNHSGIFAYKRELDDQVLLNFNNFYNTDMEIDLGKEFNVEKAEYLIGNYDNHDLQQKMTLKPYETVSYLIK